MRWNLPRRFFLSPALAWFDRCCCWAVSALSFWGPAIFRLSPYSLASSPLLLLLRFNFILKEIFIKLGSACSVDSQYELQCNIPDKLFALRRTVHVYSSNCPFIANSFIDSISRHVFRCISRFVQTEKSLKKNPCSDSCYYSNLFCSYNV